MSINQLKSIRRAKVTDCEQLSELAFRSKAYWGYSDEFMEACRAELTYTAEDINRDIVYVLADEGKLVGFYGLAKEAKTVYELAPLFIDPDFIGQGYGRQLMAHAQQTAKQLGATEITIQSDPFAAEFYARIGARKVGEKESGSINGRFLPLFSIDLN